MNFPSEAMQCVVFLGHAGSDLDPQTFQARATGFFVAVPLIDTYQIALVAARHCVRAWFEDPFHIRFNGGGKGMLQRIEDPKWTFHDDPTVDVAVMRVECPELAETKALSPSMLLQDARLERGDIGPGDLTYTVGLFTYLSGQRRNVPLVHTGHIAAFPDEERVPFPDWDAPPGKVKKFRDVEAFIVQCSAMPGASGSPVFVRKSIKAADADHVHEFEPHQGKLRPPKELPRVAPSGYGAMFLLGMWQGAWELENIGFAGAAEVRSPAGYGLVVPAQKILETLEIMRNTRPRPVMPVS